jgi:voltage-gated potassium channel
VEGGAGSSIHSFPDALWWSFVTVTTVGYGDMFPVTFTGRVIAVVLMLAGIGLFGGLTANVASLLIRTDKAADAPMNDILTEVRLLREEVANLRRDGG